MRSLRCIVETHHGFPFMGAGSHHHVCRSHALPLHIESHGRFALARLCLHLELGESVEGYAVHHVSGLGNPLADPSRQPIVGVDDVVVKVVAVYEADHVIKEIGQILGVAAQRSVDRAAAQVNHTNVFVHLVHLTHMVGMTAGVKIDLHTH